MLLHFLLANSSRVYAVSATALAPLDFANAACLQHVGLDSLHDSEGSLEHQIFNIHVNAILRFIQDQSR
jgi:hypothetical protein